MPISWLALEQEYKDKTLALHSYLIVIVAQDHTFQQSIKEEEISKLWSLRLKRKRLEILTENECLREELQEEHLSIVITPFIKGYKKISKMTHNPPSVFTSV